MRREAITAPGLIASIFSVDSKDLLPGSISEFGKPGLPNAPSTPATTTCTQNNGKPCPEWLHKLIGQYPLSLESQPFESQRDRAKVHFWTYRTWQDPPLRSNREVFRSKLFLGTHAVAAFAMIAASRRKNSGVEWHSDVPALVGVFGMDYLQFRFVGGPNAIGAPIYQAIHYARASARWAKVVSE